MNAFQPVRPPLPPVTPQPRVGRVVQRKPRHPYRALVVEVSAKLTINLLFSTAAIATLVQILPYHLSQQEKLQEIRSEVKVTEGRVNQLRTNFSRYFDPQQATSIMQEQSHRLDPKQRQVVWMEGEATPPEAATQQPQQP